MEHLQKPISISLSSSSNHSILPISDIFAVADNGHLPTVRLHLCPRDRHLLPREDQPACRVRPLPLLRVPRFLELLISYEGSPFYMQGAIQINSQSLEDTQVGYISQKYTLDKYTLEKYT